MSAGRDKSGSKRTGSAGTTPVAGAARPKPKSTGKLRQQPHAAKVMHAEPSVSKVAVVKTAPAKGTHSKATKSEAVKPKVADARIVGSTTLAPEAAAIKAGNPETAAPRPAAPKAPAPGIRVVSSAPPASAPAPSPALATPPPVQPVVERPEATASAPPLNNVEQLAAISSDLFTEGRKAGAAVLRALESGENPSVKPEESADIAKTLGAVAEYWLKDPTRLVEAQKDISLDLINLWSEMIKQAGGEKAEPVTPMPARDARFTDPEWTENPYFNFLKQAYFLGTHWAQDLVDGAKDLDDHTKRKAGFYVRQLAGALSPSNFVMTNPELLRTTIDEKGENIARGMKMLAEDIEAGKGELKIRQTDRNAFEVGVNLATTPGKVIFRNELFELIQYAPSTEQVFKTPLLIVPPWINKFYILDLTPEKSFIRWAVSQGQTVFVISWVNPDKRHRAYDFEAYMKKGILEAIRQIEEATGEKSVNAVGYCVGGTLLAVTLAYIAQGKRPERVKSATLFATQVDFTYAGELLAFVDEEQIRTVEEMMAKLGYLPGEKMAGAFNMLRPNDLIWTYMVNNYLKGKQPTPFDLLYWNSDSTRMAEANHSFYLRNCYLHNRLAKGEMVIGKRKLDLGQIKIPIYNLATREDHIAPAKSVFFGSGLFGGPVTYVLSGSGHIAGVINPVAKPKYQYWTGGPVKGAYEDWIKTTTEHPGTWWPHWAAWVSADDKKVPARKPGGGKLTPLCDAPGTYVKVRS